MNTCSKLSAKTIATFLGMAASFLRAGGLQKLKAVKTRFNTTECSATIEKQWRDVMSKARGAVGRIEDPVEMNQALAGLMEDLQKSFCKAVSEPLPTKSATTFRVKRGQSFIDAFHEQLPPALNTQIRALICESDRIYYLNSFDAREVLNEFSLFGAMMTTLSVKTEFPSYERFLEKQMNVPGWFVNGHPYDLLVHDVEDLRNSKQIKLIGIYSEPNRCSTNAVTEGNIPSEGKTILVSAA